MFILFYVTKSGLHYVEGVSVNREQADLIAAEKKVNRDYEAYIIDSNELLEELREKHQQKPMSVFAPKPEIVEAPKSEIFEDKTKKAPQWPLSSKPEADRQSDFRRHDVFMENGMKPKLKAVEIGTLEPNQWFRLINDPNAEEYEVLEKTENHTSFERVKTPVFDNTTVVYIESNEPEPVEIGSLSPGDEFIRQKGNEWMKALFVGIVENKAVYKVKNDNYTGVFDPSEKVYLQKTPKK